MLTICRFLNNAACAYSMTYDEGFLETLTNAYPIHQKYGFPGHVDVVAGQLGQRRNCYLSSMNGFFHMGAEHLRFLISQGWSVGNHSYSHFVYPIQAGLDMYREVVYSKYLLEDKLGVPITFFAIPNDKYNYEPALPYIRQAGYLGCQYIDGGVNYDDVDLLKIGNFMVAEGPLHKSYDWPEMLLTENITRKNIDGGWLCETTHLVMHNTIQPHKNITPEGLERRFVKLKEIMGDALWAAVPEDVVDYILCRRNARISAVSPTEYAVEVSTIPVGVRKRALTFTMEGEWRQISVEGEMIKPLSVSDGKTIFTHDFCRHGVTTVIFKFGNQR